MSSIFYIKIGLFYISCNDFDICADYKAMSVLGRSGPVWPFAPCYFGQALVERRGVISFLRGLNKYTRTDRSAEKDLRVKQLFFVFGLCMVYSVSCAPKAQGPGLVQPNAPLDLSRYSIVDEFNEYGIAAVADDSGWAYIDTLGRKVVVPLLYDNGPDPFVEGLARYVESGQMGFFDERGQRLIAARYDFAQSFSQGLAAVCRGCRRQANGEQHYRYVDGQWGYIDGLGSEVVPLRYEAAESFAGGRARVREGGVWTSIDVPDNLPRWVVYRGFLPELVLQHPLFGGPLREPWRVGATWARLIEMRGRLIPVSIAYRCLLDAGI
jgi:hypothetical protein